jgi:hypothetical protein
MSSKQVRHLAFLVWAYPFPAVCWLKPLPPPKLHGALFQNREFFLVGTQFHDNIVLRIWDARPKEFQ